MMSEDLAHLAGDADDVADAAAALPADLVDAGDWRWATRPVPGVVGWFETWQSGPGTPSHASRLRLLVGPGDAVLVLSADPSVHGSGETVKVLSELGPGPFGDGDMTRAASEIARRTQLRRAMWPQNR